MNWETSFDEYLEHLCKVVGHSDRRAGLTGYCRGLMRPLGRKSVEPLAAHLEPHRVSARHQSLHHFVSKSEWSDAALLEQVRRWVLPHMDPAKGLYWMIDDTGFPKKGRHSVGVARQYCGQLGKQDNCQVAVSLSVATEAASLPVAYQLYLPQEWTDDPTRRQQAGVPDEIGFATKPQIAVTQLREARQSGAPDGVVLADAGYGNDTAFRDALGELGLQYAVGIQSGTRVWPPGLAPLPAESSQGKAGRPRSLQRRIPGHDPVPVKDLALAPEPSRYHTASWREGTRATLSSRFAAVRVRASHRDYWRATPRDEEWLLIEWPNGESEPTKYWLSTLPDDTPVERLAYVAKMRWRTERDYQDLKQEFGIGHFEGRGWRGFHHHASLCIAAYGFLVAQRLIQGGSKKNAEIRNPVALPADYVPRGSPARAATRT
ncbi:transposase DDE domain protein [Paraburkholderia xenovorans LB400]|uniref:Transposase, ISRS017 n=1 Tax=Paraburkholderia xenovorans (strain LB400) TaxID=266265 RepID=Q13H50_PARXL|nr:IS701-like element ISBfun4 family transposase [Paraburkholderia xenovorans]ABE36589.1 Putative transposase, ISRS017 [Paraburkholderia xenovorans LB400]AIP35182.1 transposase DDE domain protein [Paraburkholderia xenovorans LB400]